MAEVGNLADSTADASGSSLRVPQLSDSANGEEDGAWLLWH